MGAAEYLVNTYIFCKKYTCAQSTITYGKNSVSRRITMSCEVRCFI